MVLWLMLLLSMAQAEEPEGNEQHGFSLVDPLMMLAIRSTIMEPFRIPSGSMYPTLFIGDQIWVRKWAYRINFPLTRIPISKTTLPERGDVVVFVYPNRDGQPSKQPIDLPIPGIATTDYVKRVIGLPGDRVALKEGVVYINGSPVEQELVGDDSFVNDRCRSIPVKKYTETLAGKTYSVFRSAARSYLNTYSEKVVPEGMLFVLGDNRDHSSDSRVWGFVPLGNVKGKAYKIFFSVDLCTAVPQTSRDNTPIP